MKSLASLLCLVLLASCAATREPVTRVKPTAPTILMPAESVRADLGEAAAINNQLAEGNRQIENLISEGRATRYDLNSKMAELIEAKAANETDLLEVREHLTRQQGLIDEGKVIINEQKDLIELQGAQLVEADGMISAGETEKNALRRTLEKAQEDLTTAHEIALQLAKEREDAQLDAASSAGEIDAVIRTSKRRLWWALGASFIIVFGAVWRIYSLISNPLKLVPL